jgi:methionine synthase II (cobalamin-independent)
MNAASPGVLTKFVPDRYYQDEDAYVEALANALQEEYEAIHRAGLILQIDAPDLGSARHNQYQHLSDAEFLKIAGRNIAALNSSGWPQARLTDYDWLRRDFPPCVPAGDGSSRQSCRRRE